MSDLVTAEEWAAEWLALNPGAPLAPLIQALTDRIDFLRTEWQKADEEKAKVIDEAGVLRRNIRGETEEHVAARLGEIRAAVEAISDATHDFRIAIGEDWR